MQQNGIEVTLCTMEESGFTTFESYSLHGRRFVVNILSNNIFGPTFRSVCSILYTRLILYIKPSLRTTMTKFFININDVLLINYDSILG
jgi:hypothetical protein